MGQRLVHNLYLNVTSKVVISMVVNQDLQVLVHWIKQELQRQENVLYVDILNPLPLVTVQVAELLKMLNVPTVVSVTVRMVSVNALKDILVNLAPFKLSWFKFSFKPKLCRYIFSETNIFISQDILLTRYM